MNGDNGLTSGSEDSDVPPECVGPTVQTSDVDASDNEDSDSELSDEGDLSDSEVGTSFTTAYHLAAERSVSCDGVLVLHLTGEGDRLAAALSDHSAALLDAGTLARVGAVRGHRGAISGVRFSPANHSHLYTASLDGCIKLWDLRADNSCVKEFKDATDGPDRLKPLTSFDVSCTDRYLCGGTELVGGDSFLLYWDVRSAGLLGGYWESHTDDITQVRFHPQAQNTVATGSTDGLVNVFDIGLECEDDALQHSLNTESSVGKLGWFSHGGAMSALSCITHTEHLQLWETEGAAPYLQVTRQQLARSLGRNPSDNCYLVDVHRVSDSELMVLAGSAGANGQCLRTLRISDTTITPMSDLVGNRQIVRASWFDETNGVLVTVGESGFVSVWKPGQSPIIQVVHTELKAPSKVKHSLALHSSKPY